MEKQDKVKKHSVLTMVERTGYCVNKIERKSCTMTSNPSLPTEGSFEESLKELEGLVKRLEEGQLTLDQAVEAFTRGTLLKKQCELKLQQAKGTIERVTAERVGGAGGESVVADNQNQG